MLVVTGALVPLHRLIELAALDGKRGFTTMAEGDVAHFTPTPDLALPASPVYLITAVDTGKETRGVRPNGARRSPRGRHAGPRTGRMSGC